MLNEINHIFSSLIERYGKIGLCANIVTIILPIFNLLNSIINGEYVMMIQLYFSILIIIMILIKFYSYKKHSVKIDDLYYDNDPLISTMTYLIKTRNGMINNHNELNVKSINFNIKFENCNLTSNPEDILVGKQRITTSITASNEKNYSVFNYKLLQIHSVFTSSLQLKFSIACIIDITKQQIPSDYSVKNLSLLLDEISINFKDKGIQPKSSVKIKLSRTTENVEFKNCEHFNIDPEQYSYNKKRLYFNISTDCIEINNRFFSLIEIDRKSFCKKTIYNRCQLSTFNDYCKDGITTKKNKVYMVRIEA